MQNHIQYRWARQEDLPAVAQVNLTTWQSCLADLVAGESSSCSLTQRTARLHQRFQQPAYGILVAETPAAQIIAFCDFGLPRKPCWPYEMELYSLYVLPAYQRQGIGRQLFTRALQHMVRQEIASMFLRVLATSPYQQCYSQWGGKAVGRESIPSKQQLLELVIYAWNDLPQMLGAMSE